MKNPYNGKFFSKKNKRNIKYDSCYEYVALLMLEEDPLVKRFERCNFTIPITVPDDYSFRRVPYWYNPDFLVTYWNGKQVILEIKSKGLMKYANVMQKCLAGFEFVKYTNLGYIIWTEKEMGLPGKKALHRWFYEQTGRMG